MQLNIYAETDCTRTVSDDYFRMESSIDSYSTETKFVKNLFINETVKIFDKEFTNDFYKEMSYYIGEISFINGKSYDFLLVDPQTCTIEFKKRIYHE